MNGRCRDALERAIAAKKTPVDTWFFLGGLLWTMADRPRARQCYAIYVKRARKKDNVQAMALAKDPRRHVAGRRLAE